MQVKVLLCSWRPTSHRSDADLAVTLCTSDRILGRVMQPCTTPRQKLLQDGAITGHDTAPLRRQVPQDNPQNHWSSDGRTAQCHGQTTVTLSQMARDWGLACSRRFRSCGRVARTVTFHFLTSSFFRVPYFCVVKLRSEGSCSVSM